MATARRLVAARSADALARSAGSNIGSPKPIMGFVASALRANSRKARRLATEGSTLTAWRFINQAASRYPATSLSCRYRLGRLLRHQQMEWQRGERARGHDQEMALVLHQRLDRTDQGGIKLVRELEVEQRRLARQIFAASRDRAPRGTP